MFRCSCKRNRVSSSEDRTSKTKSEHHAPTHEGAFGHFCLSILEGICEIDLDFLKADANFLIKSEPIIKAQFMKKDVDEILISLTSAFFYYRMLINLS
jgi:hypothetical protein